MSSIQIGTVKRLIFIDVPVEDRVRFPRDSYLEANYNVRFDAADETLYGNYIAAATLGPTVLFSQYKLSTFIEKLSEPIDHPLLVTLISKLLKSSFGQNDLSIGFDRDRTQRQLDLSIGTAIPLPLNIKGKLHLEMYLEDVFGFAETQKKATYGLRYELILKKRH